MLGRIIHQCSRAVRQASVLQTSSVQPTSVQQCAVQLASVRHASLLSTDKIEATVDDKTGICRLVMKNAPINILEKDMMLGLRDVVKEADTSPNISSLVISSAFPKVFSAGLDVKELLSVSEEEDRFREYWGAFQEMVSTLYLMRGASVAAINGTCVAGSFILALACDYRIASIGEYKVGLHETKLGIDIPFFASEMFREQVGQREAMASLPYGQLYDVASAYRVGIVEEVCPEGQLEAAVNNFLSEVLTIPSEARHTTKIHLRHMTLGIIKQTLQMDMEHKVEVFQRPETKKNIVDFIMAGKKNKKEQKKE